MKILLALALSLFAVKSYGQTYVTLVCNTNPVGYSIPVSYSIPTNKVAKFTSITYLSGWYTLTLKIGTAPETLIPDIYAEPLPIAGPATITLYPTATCPTATCTLEIVPQTKEQTYLSLVATNTNPVSYSIPPNNIATIFPLAGLYPTIKIGTATETDVYDPAEGTGQSQISGPATITAYGSTNSATILSLDILPVKKTQIITD